MFSTQKKEWLYEVSANAIILINLTAIYKYTQSTHYMTQTYTRLYVHYLFKNYHIFFYFKGPFLNIYQGFINLTKGWKTGTGKHNPTLFSQIQLFWIPYISDITQNLYFSVWLTLPSIMPLRSVHAITNAKTSFALMARCISHG